MDNLQLWMLAALSALQVVDVWTTEKILGMGGREHNVVMAWLFSKVGNNAYFLKVAMVFVLGWFVFTSPSLELLLVLTFLNGAYTVVALSNLTTMFKMKKGAYR